MTIDFNPSQVVLGAPPLTGTMGKSEAEHAAAVIVRVCQANGDTWQPVGWKTVASVLTADVEAKREPFASLMCNPFFRPDPFELADRGFAAWDGTPGASPVALTTKGLEALRQWVKP